MIQTRAFLSNTIQMYSTARVKDNTSVIFSITVNALEEFKCADSGKKL